MNDRVLGLFKFGKRAHIEQFVQEGHLFMNTLAYFKKLENDLLRWDKHEGSTHCLQAEGAKLRRMESDGEWEEIGTIRGQILSSNDNEQATNVFCMYAFRESAIKCLVDQRNFDFGDTFAILTNGDEFLSRVHEKSKYEKLNLKHSLVEYVEKTKYNGKMGVFRKFSDFVYQSEFRIAVIPGTNEPLSLKVGDISDISIIGNLTELNDRIKYDGQLKILNKTS